MHEALLRSRRLSAGEFSAVVSVRQKNQGFGGSFLKSRSCLVREQACPASPPNGPSLPLGGKLLFGEANFAQILIQRRREVK
jgi:hypothetical protein